MGKRLDMHFSQALAACCLCAAMLCGSMSNAAQLTNSNFETGDLSGWTLSQPPRSLAGVFGQAVDSTFGVPPLQGDYSALLVTRGWSSSTCSEDPWSGACLPIPFSSAPLDTPPPNTAYPVGYSAVLSQQVNLRAGDAVAFDFQIFSNEFVGSDQFFAALWNGGREPDDVVCGMVFHAPALTSVGDRCAVGVIPFIIPDPPILVRAGTGSPAGFRSLNDVYAWQVVAPSDGLWTLSVGIGSSVDSILSSGALVDNFHVLPRQALPEPGSLGLLLLCLAGLGITHRRQA